MGGRRKDPGYKRRVLALTGSRTASFLVVGGTVEPVMLVGYFGGGTINNFL